MPLSDEIRVRLEDEFRPHKLEILDVSEAHRGHAGYQDGGESHWKIAIGAAAFGPMNRIQRHRAVHAALGPGIIGRIHALELAIES